MRYYSVKQRRNGKNSLDRLEELAILQTIEVLGIMVLLYELNDELDMDFDDEEEQDLIFLMHIMLHRAFDIH